MLSGESTTDVSFLLLPSNPMLPLGDNCAMLPYGDARATPAICPFGQGSFRGLCRQAYHEPRKPTREEAPPHRTSKGQHGGAFSIQVGEDQDAI